NLTLQGLTLSGGAQNPGNVLFNNGGTVTLLQSLIARSFGVVVYNNGGTVKMLQSTMADNLSGLGLSLFLNTASGIVSVIQSTFVENSPDMGVIFTEGQVEITQSQFNHNRSRHDASAIFVAGGTMRITETTFAQNIADGTTIFLSAGSLTIADSAFVENGGS